MLMARLARNLLWHCRHGRLDPPLHRESAQRQRRRIRAHAQFDAFNHSTVHWSMTLVFIVGIALSAIFQAGEIVSQATALPRTRADPQWSLHKDHPDRKSLLRNSIFKLMVVGLAVACAIAFGATYAVVRAPCVTYDSSNNSAEATRMPKARTAPPSVTESHLPRPPSSGP